MKRPPRGKFDPSKSVDGGDIELTPEQHQEVLRQTAIADDECRVNFRWGNAQLDVVKLVAEKMGVPYQQYIKQVLFRQAYADLERFQSLRPPVPVSEQTTWALRSSITALQVNEPASRSTPPTVASCPPSDAITIIDKSDEFLSPWKGSIKTPESE